MFGYIPDSRIAIICGVYFLLSLLMAWIVDRLPFFSWVWSSVWGIIWVNVGLVFFVWLPRGELLHPITVLIEEYLVFASSLPPLAIGEYRQYRSKKNKVEDDLLPGIFCSLVGIQAKLDSIFAYLVKEPVEDVQRN